MNSKSAFEEDFENMTKVILIDKILAMTSENTRRKSLKIEK